MSTEARHWFNPRKVVLAVTVLSLATLTAGNCLASPVRHAARVVSSTPPGPIILQPGQNPPTTPHITLTKPEWGLPAGSVVGPTVTFANCLQPTATIRAHEASLTDAQDDWYGYPPKSQFASHMADWWEIVDHDLHHSCTMQAIISWPGGAKFNGGGYAHSTTSTKPLKEKPLTDGGLFERSCTSAGQEDCWSGYYTLAASDNGWQESGMKWRVAYPLDSSKFDTLEYGKFGISEWDGIGGLNPCGAPYYDNLFQTGVTIFEQTYPDDVWNYWTVPWVEYNGGSNCDNFVNLDTDFSHGVSPGDSMVAWTSYYGDFTLEDYSTGDEAHYTFSGVDATEESYECVDEPENYREPLGPPQYDPTTIMDQDDQVFSECYGENQQNVVVFNGDYYWYDVYYMDIFDPSISYPAVVYPNTVPPNYDDYGSFVLHDANQS